MSLPQITALIIAVTGVAGVVVSYKLGKRGQHVDERQQAAATKLQERIAAFDELESLNDRLKAEVDRYRDLLTESETRGDARLAAQARRCSQRLEESVLALTTLQSVVLSEIAGTAASDAAARARQHIAGDHPEK